MKGKREMNKAKQYAVEQYGAYLESWVDQYHKGDIPSTWTPYTYEQFERAMQYERNDESRL